MKQWKGIALLLSVVIVGVGCFFAYRLIALHRDRSETTIQGKRIRRGGHSKSRSGPVSARAFALEPVSPAGRIDSPKF